MLQLWLWVHILCVSRAAICGKRAGAYAVNNEVNIMTSSHRFSPISKVALLPLYAIGAIILAIHLVGWLVYFAMHDLAGLLVRITKSPQVAVITVLLLVTIVAQLLA